MGKMTKDNKKKPRSREADSTIRGFQYQLLQTQKQILLSIKNHEENKFLVEGVEDLDLSGDRYEFQQYKYYESTIVTASKIEEPIAYMYCHWKMHHSQKFFYKLFIYTKNLRVDIKSANDLAKILAMSAAKGILDKTLSGDEKADPEIDKFYLMFSLIEVSDIETTVNEVIDLIKSVLHKRRGDSKDLYYPLISQYIASVAIAKTEIEREISLSDFQKHIDDKDVAITHRIVHGFVDDRVLVRACFNEMKQLEYCNSHHYNYVLRFGKNWQGRISAQMILDIASLFASKGQRCSNKPVTFLLDFKETEMNQLKKQLIDVNINVNQLIMNDGFESIQFTPSLFNADPMQKLLKNHTLYEALSYNYRVALMSNSFNALPGNDPYVFDFDIESKMESRNMAFSGFGPDFVRQLMEELHK